MIYRGAELDRTYARLRGQVDLSPLIARVYETRTTARNALYSVGLSTTSEAIERAANSIFDASKSIKDSNNIPDLKQRRDRIEKDIGDLIKLAANILGVSLQ